MMNFTKLLVTTSLILFSQLGISQCGSFADFLDSNEIEENYAIFKDLFIHEEYAEALPYWEKVYKTAPALDGKTNHIYVNGISLFTTRLNEAETEKAKRGIANFIIQLYNEHRVCFPDKELEPISRDVLDLVGVKGR